MRLAQLVCLMAAVVLSGCSDDESSSAAQGHGGASASSAMAGGGIDCSNVGCGAPPTCDVGCTAPCGCCPCSPGQTMGGLVCMNGCYAEVTDGGDGDGG